MELIRAAMRRAARQSGWRVRAVGHARERLVLVIVQAIREESAEVSEALGKGLIRKGQEMIKRMSADGDKEALSR
ncbi:hypothetical protein GCM10010358_38530 [Streptomyces minutiscleroticus]|uniref:Uncharacterized protein n=1 Tax=Streptomyces minutiscleroticus TaxID=68238 RepID=A0A918U1S3_9ACTN|nr:hypothetical protein GCM10010358_38530 [Streptomyces minutiscleroticus]